MPEIQFSREKSTMARGRNGWFTPNSAHTGSYAYEDTLWLDVRSARWGTSAIQLRLTRGDMKKLHSLIGKTLKESAKEVRK